MPPEAPWLHKTKAFAPRPRPGMNIRVGNVGNMIGKTTILRNKNQKKWNGKIEKQTPPTVFLNKQNYIGLKERLQSIIEVTSFFISVFSRLY